VISALLLLVGGIAGGVFGSVLGLGGGILIVPMLTLGFGRPLREAVAVSLVSVIVTSTAAAGVYLQRHVANLRLGMVLELFTAIGALVGGLVAFLLDERLLAGLFAALLVYVAVTMLRRPAERRVDEGAATEAPASGFVSALAGPGYTVRNLPGGIAGSALAGVVSALLGVGGGIVKVPTMHLVMGVPLRVATATSNLMIGITATAGAVIYLLRGELDAYIAGPVAFGVFVGAVMGSRTAHRIDVRYLRWVFVLVLAYMAFQMARRAIGWP
jgi:uncharacterized membrane protein YfcA